MKNINLENESESIQEFILNYLQVLELVLEVEVHQKKILLIGHVCLNKAFYSTNVHIEYSLFKDPNLLWVFLNLMNG